MTCVTAKTLQSSVDDLCQLTQESIGPERGSPVSDKLGIETRIALGEDSADLDVTQLGKLSEFACPECHGTRVTRTLAISVTDRQ